MAVKVSVRVATVLTVYGIETLPATVSRALTYALKLQQYLPFTVLKQAPAVTVVINENARGCNSTYRLRY